MYREEHPPPHFHAKHGGRSASLTFDGHVLHGTLHPRALRLVRRWARLREHELRTNWRLAGEGRYVLRGPVFEPFRSPEGFARLAVDHDAGTIVWSDQADIAPETLYLMPDERGDAA